jgi:hypothetical protein
MRAFLRCVLAICAAGAAGCVHAQAGPLFGVSNHGPVVGFEAGAGVGMLSGSFGVEVRPLGERVASFYAAGEPAIAVPVGGDRLDQPPSTFLSGGGTIGGAVDEHGDSSLLAGGWGAVPWIVSGDCRSSAASASVSIGVHVFIDGDAPVWTVYGSPKLGVIQDCPDFRMPVTR